MCRGTGFSGQTGVFEVVRIGHNLGKIHDAPLARFQLVQEMIADMILKRDASRMLVFRAGMLKDEGKPNATETI